MNTPTNLTILETAMIRTLATSEYSDRPGDAVWATCLVSKAYTKRQIPGIVSSLVKKGLVCTCGEGSDATVALTHEGVSAWNSLVFAAA